jgi:predicted nuclease with TOPRIM domain
LNIIKQQRIQDQPKLDELRQETSALTQTLRQLKHTQEKMSDQIDDLKKKKSTVTENIVKFF